MQARDSKRIVVMLRRQQLPVDWQPSSRDEGINRCRLSIRFAQSLDMTGVSRLVRQIPVLVGRVLPRTVAVIIGFIMIALGLGMTATVVMLPAGVVISLFGVAVLASGMFAPDMRSEPRDRH